MATTFNSTEATCIYLQKVKLFKVLGVNLFKNVFTFLSLLWYECSILFFVSLQPQIPHSLSLSPTTSVH